MRCGLLKGRLLRLVLLIDEAVGFGCGDSPMMKMPLSPMAILSNEDNVSLRHPGVKRNRWIVQINSPS